MTGGSNVQSTASSRGQDGGAYCGAAVDGKMYVVKSKVGPVCLFCVMVWLVLVYGKILGQLEKSTLPTLFPLRRLEGE